jgi:poly-gamma-glutamate synthesis protein (capsule biosynthesis protein)
MRKTTLLILLFCFWDIAFAQEQKVSFLFAGDAMQHQSQINTAKTKDGFDYTECFRQITDMIEADIAVVNLEVTLAGKPYRGYPLFSAPDEYAFALKDMGFNVFMTANNHSADKGKKGIERTIQVLDSMRVKHTGTFISAEKRDLYYPLMMIKNGIRIAMLNYTYDTNGLPVDTPNIVNLIDKKQISEDIMLAKQMKADIIIANMHWGYEHKLKPSKEQKELADFLIDNGVRLVIGSHPHVVQPVDIRKGDDGEIDAIIVYSLGNFVSGMKPVNTTGGMLFNIDISKDGDNPVSIDAYDYSLVWTHKMMDDDENITGYKLLPVDKYYIKGGEKLLGAEYYQTMTSFADTAKRTIENMWEKE